MKTHFCFITLVLFLVVFMFEGCTKKEDHSYPHELVFLTEDYPPLNYTEGGKLKGLAPELLRRICNKLDMPFEARVLPWSEAMTLAKNDPKAVLFSTVITQDRKDEFNWVGPYATLDWRFYGASSNPLEINTIEDAKQVPAIGLIPDYAINEFLVDEGFTNLVYCENIADAFTKLLNGSVSLVPSSDIVAQAALKGLNKSFYDVRPSLLLENSFVYFAFNKAIPQEVIHDFQYELDQLKVNGQLELLYQEFMQTNGAPGILQVFTEQYPPLTFRNSYGEITGFGTDVVKEIMRRNQRFYDIRLTLWSNAYQQALLNPNFCLFTMDRTPIRENLFRWVGPIGTNATYFYVKKGSGISISTVDEARSLNAIGTVTSWFSDQYLRELGFTNLVAVGDPTEMINMLMNGEVQAIVCTNITIADIVRQAGFAFDQLQPETTLLSSDYYIAFSRSTNDDIVTQWQTALEAAKTDGTYAAILRKWFPIE
ncbi:MAG: transporter substrate-binding domain-containing protein [Bacteroidales bacterium]|nr:transporter substrate-binding domain-containing protein [Bacteroidales bacterium]